MILKVEHIGIAVSSISNSNTLFSKLLGANPYKEERVNSEGVLTSFFQVGETKIELVGSTKEGSAINKFLEKRGEGIHHLAFFVDNIDLEMNRLKKEGFQFINDEPKMGADQKRIAFLHPKSTNGVLIELCEDYEK
ncbi:MAG: methylmalonyl-CoA/ethylmalonyl-CoA epimerase [Bacteroidia bacterium]|jgi:methylmalonyl-CoA/ethylmalonyl-CoA epimerase